MCASPNKQHVRWVLFPTEKAAAQATCDYILNHADEAIKARGRFSLVLSGGRTPVGVNTLLSQAKADWINWHLYFADERCLPAAHADLNNQMVIETLASRVPIPEEQVHRIQVELGPETAASAYARILEAVTPFDLVTLGLGEDGHTASLFPGHNHPTSKSVVPVYNSPKPPLERVSLSIKTLSNCRNLILLVTGQQKRNVVSRWKKGEVLPVSQVNSIDSIDVFIDQFAWGSDRLE